MRDLSKNYQNIQFLCLDGNKFLYSFSATIYNIIIEIKT